MKKNKSQELILKDGYLVFKRSLHLYHRRVYVNAHGKIPKGWFVHHMDGNKLNNDPQNLIAIPKELHAKAMKAHPLPRRLELEEWIFIFNNKHQAKDDNKFIERRLKKIKRKEIKNKIMREIKKPKSQRIVRTSEEFKGVVKRYTPKGKLIT